MGYNREHWYIGYLGAAVKKFYMGLALALNGVVSAQAQVRPGEQLGLRIGVELDVRAVENADLQPDSADNISEVQYVGRLMADGRLRGAWADFSTNYNWEHRNYSERDEEDQRILLGRSQLTLGPQHRLYYAQFSHSSQEISLDPLVEDVSTNRDNREIFTGALVGNLRPGNGNLLTLSVDATDIQFERRVENEAKRFGLGLNFNHAISPLYKLGVALSGYDLTYRYLEDSDFTYTSLALVWQAELRRLEYGIQLGTNSMETDWDKTRSPHIQLDARYLLGAQSFSATYVQFLSDTSQGSGEVAGRRPSVGVDGRVDNEVDQFKSRQLLLAWRHTQICDGCSWSIDAGIGEEDYLNIPELSSRQMQIRTDFSYRATPNLRLGLRVSAMDFEETQDPSGLGFRQADVLFTTSFPNLIRNGELNVYVGATQRDFDSREGYDSSYIGARFRYGLYER
jgi:hypothetical protein